MQQQEFASQLAVEGYDEVLTKTMPAGPEVPAHTHPFAVKALVIDGTITLGVAGQRTDYKAGDVFTMAPGCEHTEWYGEAGVTYVVGRRHG